LAHTSAAAEGPLDWVRSSDPVAYETAVGEMEARIAEIRGGRARECIWLLEHPSLYTAGTSARPEDLIDANRFPVHRSGRGGQFTYHGPGQRIAYVMLDLQQRGRDVRGFVYQLEDCIIATLGRLGVVGERRQGRVGVWVARPELGPGREDKIAAIGVRIRRWVSFHGLSLNVAPELEHYSSIIPCGISGHGVTSLADLGVRATMDDVDDALIDSFEEIFGSSPPHS